MANGTSGIGSSSPIYPSIQPQQVAPTAVPANAVSPDQQLQALVQAAQGGDATAIQTLNQLQSSGALDAYLAAAGGAAAPGAVGPSASAPTAGTPSSASVGAPAGMPTADTFSPATAAAAPSAPAPAAGMPGASAADPYGLLSGASGDPVVNDGTVDPAAAAKAKSGGMMSDLAHYAVLSGAYKNWKVDKGLLAGDSLGGNGISRSFKTAGSFVGKGASLVGSEGAPKVGETLADGKVAKAGQAVTEVKLASGAKVWVPVQNGLLSKLPKAGALAMKIDTATGKLAWASQLARMGYGPAGLDGGKLSKLVYKLNDNKLARSTAAFSSKYLTKFDNRLTARVSKSLGKRQAIIDAAKALKAEGKVNPELKTALKAAKSAESFFGKIGRFASKIPGVKFLTTHAVGLRKVAVIGSVINGAIDLKKSIGILTDPNASAAKKFFSVTAVAGDVVGVMSKKVPVVGQLVGDGVAYASAYGRDHS